MCLAWPSVVLGSRSRDGKVRLLASTGIVDWYSSRGKRVDLGKCRVFRGRFLSAKDNGGIGGKRWRQIFESIDRGMVVSAEKSVCAHGLN